jgi:hypothetical protein
MREMTHYIFSIQGEKMITNSYYEKMLGFSIGVRTWSVMPFKNYTEIVRGYWFKTTGKLGRRL